MLSAILWGGGSQWEPSRPRNTGVAAEMRRWQPTTQQTGSTGRAKLINGILDPIAVGPTGIAMLASPFDGGELAHGELAESR